MRQVAGSKTLWIAPPTIHATLARPLYPSLHPHWRHLQPEYGDGGGGSGGGGGGSESIDHLFGVDRAHGDGVERYRLDSMTAEGDEPVWSFALNPGDAAFIPPYFFHATEPAERYDT